MSDEADLSVIFRLNITDENLIEATIEVNEPDATYYADQEEEPGECTEGECTDEGSLELSIDATLGAARARAAELWGRARDFLNDYKSPAKRRARELHRGALELTAHLKQSTAVTALELKEATVTNALEFKEATTATALELKMTTSAKVVATTDQVARGLADVTNHLSSRTQQLAGHPTAQKAVRGLEMIGEARASVVSKVRQADVVRTVSSGAEHVALSIREFASIQKF